MAFLSFPFLFSLIKCKLYDKYKLHHSEVRTFVSELYTAAIVLNGIALHPTQSQHSHFWLPLKSRNVMYVRYVSSTAQSLRHSLLKLKFLELSCTLSRHSGTDGWMLGRSLEIGHVMMKIEIGHVLYYVLGLVHV